MKKIYRRVISIVMTIAIALCLSSSVAVAQVPQSNEINTGNGFLDLIDCLFNGNGEVYDENGVNITDYFVSKYAIVYENKDYEQILNAWKEENIYRIHGYKHEIIETRAILHPTYLEMDAQFVQQKEMPYQGKGWYILVTASGNYGYHDSYDRIIYFPPPTISVKFYDLGQLFYGTVNSTNTTDPVISSDKKSATFSATITHSVFGPPPAGYIDIELGPFTTVSNFKVTA